ncbi:MAG: hypothetical protein E6G59_01235 [Actinobacteria bacterium]|nr:MAG: hypothetical protein E6G59_01235 [Actinomycetota bacterium]
MRSARGGIVLGWIFKLILMLAIVALASFETGAIIVAKVTADRVAIDAASEAGNVFASTKDESKARAAADQVAAKDHTTVVRFSVSRDRTYVEVTIRKKASTFVIQHIGFLKRFATADSTHDGTVQ